MKKVLSFLFIAIIISSLSSCSKGRSVPVEMLKQSNRIGTIMTGGTVAYSETVEYFKNDGNLSYEIYYELADGASYTYNIAETIGDFSHYISEGRVFTEKNGRLSQKIFSNPALTYAKYIKEYIDAEFPLDGGVRYQLSSSSDDDFTYVTYYATVTPQMASSIYSAKLFAGDKIISSYKIDQNRRIYAVEYGVKKASGETEKLARRSFAYFDEKQNKFSSLPQSDKKITVEFDLNGNKFKRTASDGVDIIFEDGGLGYEYYIDSAFTQKYDPKDFGDLSIYIKTHSD